jgi:RND superfamily putative drug exporter
MRHQFGSAMPPSGGYPPTAPHTELRAASHNTLVERVATWSMRHRKAVVTGWLVAIAIVFVAGHLVGTSTAQSNDPGQSGVAEATLQRLRISQPPSEGVLIQARGGGTSRTDPQLRQATGDVVRALSALPRSTASDIQSPATTSSLISADGRSALVTFNVTGANEDQAVLPALHAVAAVQDRYPGLRIAEAGGASEDRTASALLSRDFCQAETTSLPVTLILLVGVFGALVAAGIPLLLAATAVIAAISLTSVIGQWLPTGQSTSEVVLLIGMAVGVDYSLFYLRREREERARGRGTLDALRIAAATSGRAIVVSGLTVMIALAGLFLTGYSVFTGIGLGTIAVVGVTVAGSVTFLPALLAWLGPRADRGYVPFLGRRRAAAQPPRLWSGLARRVVRRPIAWGAVAVVAMLALAAPALGMRLGNPADGGFPASLPVVQTADQIERAFPAEPAPAQVVVTGHDLTGPAVRAAVAALARTASATGPSRPPVTAASVAGGRALIVDVPLAGSRSDARADAALLSLRERILPDTLGKVSGISYAVTGQTANNYDDLTVLHTRTPLVLAVVAGMAFLLLLLVFDSVAIALISVGLNLLSVAAAFGILTLIFQDGHLQSLLGFTSFGAVVSWVPLFTFVFLFGISMDYHVFILSRIRELRHGGASTKDAVVGGIGGSAGVVTSAAVIMVAVFSILATLSIIQTKMLGVSLAATVLIDATVVRGVLLPAALAVLGERTWYLPRWLRWAEPDRDVRHDPAVPGAESALRAGKAIAQSSVKR